MNRKIVGFHQDNRKEWVAELECGHSQHVRHNPPFQGRAKYLGVPVECSFCLPPSENPAPSDQDKRIHFGS